ncbi:3381_t:CDS:2 [Dentiscutata erythropus]|uniref:3381_t:CDS:1 n=1 Tax=Dentiscutata erythropus TaxID=1348616 RepID=A0A9N9FCY0_9GLOM|nr:3381_t:CDS:2 [Dentiscutata erythropus]
MDQIFALEYFDAIFRFLSNYKDLHSCLLVNKRWATCAVPILWEVPFRIKDKKKPSSKVIQVYLAFIPDSTFQKLRYNKRIGLMISKPLFFNYPSFLKELSYDQFLNAAIANKCCKDIIIELFKMLTKNSVRLRRFDIYNYLNYYSEDLNNIGSLILPHFSESTSIFSRLTYFNCCYQWPKQKTQLFNAIARGCHNIKNLKVSICYEDEKIPLANLICSQRNLKKFSLINSNKFASFPVQALVNQKHSLNSLTLEDMHCNRSLNKAKLFNYDICRLNGNAIDVLAQCTKINKMKFKHCEGLNSSAFLPLAIAFPNLTSLEYFYGDYNIYDSATPIRLLSGLIMTSCNTLKRIILDWHSPDDLEITQLVEIIAQQVINLEYLKIPLYTLEQFTLIHQTHNPLKKLEIYASRRINPYCALYIFANVPLKSLEHSIQLCFDYYDYSKLKFNPLNQIFESILYKSTRIVDFVLYTQLFHPFYRTNLLRNYPKLRINILKRSRDYRNYSRFDFETLQRTRK